MPIITSQLILAAAIALDAPLVRHITFDGIPPTTYTHPSPTSVTARVERSSSFLLLPFPAPRSITHVRFQWRLTAGKLTVPDAAAESTKAGDDAVLRIGLLIAGSAPFMPMFAPAWIKAVRDDLKAPADSVLYLVAGARHAPATSWESPYSSSMELVSVASSPPTADGWQTAEFTATPPRKTVGLWIMADGDGTRSLFTTELRELELTDLVP